jgi:hypothetical protein
MKGKGRKKTDKRLYNYSQGAGQKRGKRGVKRQARGCKKDRHGCNERQASGFRKYKQGGVKRQKRL